VVWVETGPDRYDQGGGTYRFDGRTWEPLGDDTWAGEGSIATAPDSTVWIMSDESVARFDGERWITYTSKNGLIGDRVNGMAIDPGGAPPGGGVVWVATNSGLSRFVPPPK
jgi:hypothetical protein